VVQLVGRRTCDQEVAGWTVRGIEGRQFTKAQMRKFFHIMKVLISYHVSATLIVIENRNNGLQNRKLDFTRYAGKPYTVYHLYSLFYYQLEYIL